MGNRLGRIIADGPRIPFQYPPGADTGPERFRWSCRALGANTALSCSRGSPVAMLRAADGFRPLSPQPLVYLRSCLPCFAIR